MELTPSTIKRYHSSLSADNLATFRSLKDSHTWYDSTMSRFIMFLLNNNYIDAYRNNLDVGFVRGCDSHSVDYGDIIFSPDMKFYTTEVAGVRSKYKFENGTIKHNPAECWYLVHRDLQTQVFQKYKKVSIETQDEILRDNTECPCCLEKLEGMLFHCEHQHQVCLKCFDNLSSPKKCPVCRTAYKVLEVRRFEDAKGKKEVMTQEIHFTGSKVEREYKLVGLAKSILGSYSYFTDLTPYIIQAGLFHYVLEAHLPLLEDRGNHSVFTPEMLDSQAWNDFFLYLKSETFKDILYKTGRDFQLPNSYDEATFLRHLSLKYGNDAMNILTEVSRDRSRATKNALSFKMCYEFVYLQTTHEEIKQIFKKFISGCFTKCASYRKTWDVIQSEIAE